MQEQNGQELPSSSAALALASVCATDYLWGAVDVTFEGGWARPQRFNLRQRRAISSCLAWHPGLFRQMSQTTAGICLRFSTDATEVKLAVRLDEAPVATKTTLRGAGDGDSEGPASLGGVSVVVDGRRLGVVRPHEDAIRFLLADPKTDSGNGIVALPGLGARHEVAIWLPCLCGCSIRQLWCDGTYVEKLESRHRLLVFGDELGQGFCCEDPSMSWAALMAEDLGLELVNQSLAGQVFQPAAILDATVSDVAYVVVELGGNYCQERCDASSVSSDIRGFFSEVARHWPEATTCAITPTWATPQTATSGSCFARVPSLIERLAPKRKVHVVDGGKLCAPGLVRLPSGAEVLDAAGNERFSARLRVMLGMATQSDNERREQALKLLGNAPSYAHPALEAVRREVGEVEFAQPGCVVIRVRDGSQMVYAPETELAVRVCPLFVRARRLSVLGKKLHDPLQATLGRAMCDAYHVCIYKRSRPIEVDPHLASCVRTLDESYLDEIVAAYAQARLLERTWLERALREQRFLGAFEDGELVGIAGENPDGSLGAVEVLEDRRREGWGFALEAAKVNESIVRGETPWTEVRPHDKVSLRLQRKLGFTVYSSKQTCYLSGART